MFFLTKLFKNINILIFSFVFLGIIFLSIYSYADWQNTLESNFDIVETFDQLKDWTGSKLDGYSTSDLPVKLDGSASIWGEYSCVNAKSTSGDWIGDHSGPNEWVNGAANNMRYHKSLCIDYDNANLDTIAYGPDRLRTYWGGGNPEKGYSDVYVFMMVKITSSFYPAKVDGSFPVTGYHKFLHVSSGFRDVHNWGTKSQQALCSGSLTNQCAHIYGNNYYILHTYTGPYPNDPFFRWRTKYSNPDGTSKINGDGYVSDASILKFVDGGDWFGFEMRFHLGTVDASDGYARVWVYDANGKIVGEDQSPNEKNLAKYSHKYNLLNIGGNRATNYYKTAETAHYYIDDVIINNSQIGPKYFLLLGKNMTSSVTSTEVPSYISQEKPPTIPKIWIVK